MSEESLLSIVETARDWIESGDNDRAIEVGRRVLGFFPKYWAAYRLLGEASLEKGELEDAEDMFGRVLSVDPEDLLSRVGLATVHDRRGSLDLAIWHMERAYESSPANAQLRQELQRLYLQRDGAARPRLKLSAGGVARLYAKAGRWAQAVVEYRTLLEQNPGLADLQVALAEALWNANRRTEAAQACEDILSRFPYCLKACLILGEIWLRGDRQVEGRALLQKALALDPEGVVAAKVLGERSPLPLRVVGLPTGTEAAAQLETEQLPAAAPVIGPSIEPAVQPLQEAPVLQEPEQVAPEKAEIAAPAAAAVASAEEEPIPEWLRRLRQQTPSEPAPVQQKAPTATWVGGTEPKPPAPVEEASVPDWLERLRRRKQEERSAPEPEIATKAQSKPTNEPVEAPTLTPEGKSDEAPEWLRHLRQGEPESHTVEQVPALTVSTVPEVPPFIETAQVATISAQIQPVSEQAPVSATEAGVEIPAIAERAPEDVSAPATSALAPVANELPPATTVEPAAELVTATPVEAPRAVEPDWLRDLQQLEPSPEPSGRQQPPTAAPAETASPVRTEATSPQAEAAPPPMEHPAIAPEAVAAPAPDASASGPDQTLARAQSLRDSGNADASLEQYASLIEHGMLLDRVEADLSAGAEGTLRSSRTFTLLGDLYMKQGKLQKALQAYKRALAQLG